MEQLPPLMIVIERLVAGAILGLLPMLLAWHAGRSTLAMWSYFITMALALVLGFIWAASFAIAVSAMVSLGVWRRERAAMRRTAQAETRREQAGSTGPKL